MFVRRLWRNSNLIRQTLSSQQKWLPSSNVDTQLTQSPVVRGFFTSGINAALTGEAIIEANTQRLHAALLYDHSRRLESQIFPQGGQISTSFSPLPFRSHQANLPLNPQANGQEDLTEKENSRMKLQMKLQAFPAVSHLSPYEADPLQIPLQLRNHTYPHPPPAAVAGHVTSHMPLGPALGPRAEKQECESVVKKRRRKMRKHKKRKLRRRMRNKNENKN
mmetsp:Transcript_7522/g.12882  ORF Transcript_7522/g.12882 Transcript_7522/m.12882 type:complete len:220 (+) Transcript_7522:83-742(+)|eukprot:CAMPEP_0196656492 /NCGR_PEP_ID=MMETSP1086-20130531/17414_1 /TAXON_ID=77921 /ORGANISM="Cyanoptyche  gloeocystis , Strain SAG4.97" /LENGTH=219 /DNA_ID=CAMNT_0041989255 /DNA_START=81 /DNA_END=740 /DNA_ORIENTATION=-